MTGLEYTDQAARRLEAIYLSKDVIAQRNETLRQLQLRRGEHVLDIGCGPGYLCESIAEVVGNSGRVVGIDISSHFIARADGRKGHDWIAYRVGDAASLDETERTFDVAVCTQVAEYVPDVDRVLSEAWRVLKPGGRAVFVATDWDSVIWHSDRPQRMAAVMKSWEAHCAHPKLPRSLAGRLRHAGFRVDGANVFPILNLSWGDDAYSKGLTGLIRDFVAKRNDVAASDLAAWEAEQPALDGEDRYFFSTIRFIFRASKGT
jgi:arsenite methyltransferase